MGAIFCKSINFSSLVSEEIIISPLRFPLLKNKPLPLRFHSNSSINIINSIQLSHLSKNGLSKRIQNVGILKGRNSRGNFHRMTKRLANISSLSLHISSHEADFRDFEWKKFCMLYKLKSLDLCFIKYIPDSNFNPICLSKLKHLKFLKNLSLSFYHFDNVPAFTKQSIPIKYLAYLRKITLNFHRSSLLSQTPFMNMLQDMRRFKNLKLNLVVHHIAERKMLQNYIQKIGCLPQLKSFAFVLDSKDIDSELTSILSETTNSLQKLTSFKLIVKNVKTSHQDSILVPIFSSIQRLKHLSKLNLQIGSLCSKGIESPRTSNGFFQLQKLKIHISEQDSGILSFISALEQMTHLRALEWNGNFINSRTLNKLSNRINKLTQLENISLSLTLENSHNIEVPEFHKFSKLAKLEIGEFPNDPYAISALLRSVANCSRLKIFTIHDKNIIDHFPEELFYLCQSSCLESIWLGTISNLSQRYEDLISLLSRRLHFLTKVDLSFSIKCSLEADSLIRIFQILSYNLGISLRLTLSMRNLNETDMKGISYHLVKLNHVNKLHLKCEFNPKEDDNSIYNGFLNLSTAISYLKRLEDLSIEFYIGTLNLRKGIKCLCDGLNDLTLIKRLNLKLKNSLGQFIEPGLLRDLYGKIFFMFELKEVSICLGHYSLFWKNNCSGKTFKCW
jgi:hypothetical protein